MTDRLLIYGANGYVGRAVAALAEQRGLSPVVAGRSVAPIRELADSLGVEHRVFEADDVETVERNIAETAIILNCAGPFVHTHRPFLEACLKSGTHYLDISGEPPVYGSMAAFDEAAISARMMILPSVGFDVVATDSLAVYLKQKLPSATHLTLAFHQDGPAGAPPGTLATLIEMLAYGSTKLHRLDGVVLEAPGRRSSRTIDFGNGPVEASMMTWGDLWLAYASTGIPNIENFLVLPTALKTQLDAAERFRPLFRLPMMRRLAKRVLRGGADPVELAGTSTWVWGEVSDDEGNRVRARLEGPEAGLVWTARAAVVVVERVLDGDLRPGFQTPASVYGPDLTLAVEGVRRFDS